MLQALEMFGFKSFADRTRFDFAPGVTCVVGPNGSGKSNVVDALKWILGDQSPKSLRGKEMTDVIFNGSANRKPAGLAEATLVFDNSKRLLSVDADQVQIGRRIYRSGEAEYLINRTPARLKDVKDLFLGTGAGTSAYSIIEQGRVDQLLQASTLARRVVFEEAAGISRFKVRKVDAQRKLERVAQNLLRLTDIVQEVEGQLNTLRSQAAKAAKFREYSQELRELRIGAAADDYRALSARLDSAEKTRGKLEHAIAGLLEQAQDCEARQRLAESQLAEAEDRLRDSERRAAENREAIAGYEATVRHQTARKQELDAEWARLEQQQSDLTARAEAVVGELSQTEVDLEAYADEYERRRETLSGAEQTAQEIGQRVAEVRERLDRNRTLLLDAVRQMSVAASRVAALEAHRESRLGVTASVRERIDSLQPLLAQCERTFAGCNDEIQAVLEQQSQLREQLQALHARRATLLVEQAASQNRLAELREQRGAIQARRGLLEDLELRQEGLGVGVKEILALAREASRPPWNHIRGHVVELLEIDLEHAALLEVALGNRAQLVVIDESRPLLEYLSGGEYRIAGRVGFLALAPADRAEGENPEPPAAAIDLTGQPGVVCRADRLVRSASGIPRLAERLLADTWIVSTLEAAHRLAAQIGDASRYVTLQGELLEANGTLYVGSVRSESSLVSRKSELRGIKAEMARLDRQIAAEDQALARGAAELRDAAQAEQHGQFDLDLCSHRVSELRNAANAAELDLERVRRDRDDALADSGRIAAELAQLAPEQADAQAELSQGQQAHDELQAAIARDELQVAEDESRQQQLQSLSAAEQRDLAKFEERLQHLQQARSRLDQERLQRDMHREEAQRRCRLLADKRNQIEVEIVNTNAALVELARQRELYAADVERLQGEREHARRQRGELADRDLAVRHQLRDLRDQAHAVEMQTTQMRHQIASIADRLRDEYQVELVELVATGASARAARPAPAEGTPDPAPDDTPPAEAAAPTGPADDEQLRAEIEEQINRLRRKIKQLGQVNTDSLNALDELENRFARLSGQLQDLVEAKNTLEEIIRRINSESRRMFVETFDQVRGNFQELFRKLFGGGEGDVVLEDPEDVLECGIDVVARPPGKELRSISLLSGGEKTMTAVALLLAIFKSKPSPFCILDEVDAALDDGNVGRYMGVIQEFRQWTQFIIVSHRKHTMAAADVLYGVTMEEAGVSKRMSVRFEDVSEDGHFRTTGAQPAPPAGGEALPAA